MTGLGQRILPVDDLADPLFNQLKDAAAAARENAHAPYSKFRVGAALMDEDGRIFAGCNVENASFPLGTCAEAVALGAMVTGGGKGCTHILVIGGEGGLSPCGGCRQSIAEFAGPDCVVYSLAADGTQLMQWTIGELLPHAFALKE